MQSVMPLLTLRQMVVAALQLVAPIQDVQVTGFDHLPDHRIVGQYHTLPAVPFHPSQLLQDDMGRWHDGLSL